MKSQPASQSVSQTDSQTDRHTHARTQSEHCWSVQLQSYQQICVVDDENGYTFFVDRHQRKLYCYLLTNFNLLLNSYSENRERHRTIKQKRKLQTPLSIAEEENQPDAITFPRIRGDFVNEAKKSNFARDFFSRSSKRSSILGTSIFFASPAH